MIAFYCYCSHGNFIYSALYDTFNNGVLKTWMGLNIITLSTNAKYVKTSSFPLIAEVRQKKLKKILLP